MVSIIIPVYNSAKHLSECIESVLCQSFADFELLLIDDGSTDQSSIICDRFAALDNRIVTVHQLNSGVSNARNNGIKLAKGEWITFLDSDDLITSNYIEDIVSNNDIHGLTIMQAVAFSSAESNYWPISFPSGRFSFTSTEIIDSVLYYGTPWGKLYNKNVLLSNNIWFDETISNHEDHIFFFRYLIEVDYVVLKRSSLYRYRLDVDNSLSKKMPKYSKLIYSYNILDSLLTKLLQKHNLSRTQLSTISHFLLSLKIKALRSCVFYNEPNDIFFNVLSIITKQEVLRDYKADNVKHLLIKLLLLCPNIVILVFFKLFRRYLS